MALPSGTPARRSRPSYVAAPPLLAESEPFEGAAVLQEHAGALGVLLWKTLRDVTLWLSTPEERRRGLFPAGAAAERRAEVAEAAREPELWVPLLVVAELLARPAEEHPARVVNACRSLARWAEGRQAPAAQLAFTQAAALLVPENPRLAYAVGRLARERAEYARAETWLRRAIKLARGKDWEYYALSYLSLGTLYQHLGNLPAARALTTRGTRSAGRRRLRYLEGRGYHNLFVLAAEAFDARRAHDAAAAALRCYGGASPLLPVLAQDVASFWVNRGSFARAIPVFEAVLPRIPEAEVQVIVAANLGRAAGAVGDRTRFDRSWKSVFATLPACRTDERVGDPLVCLARGAASLEDWARAEDAASLALDVARRRRQAQVQFEAETLLDDVRSSRTAGERAAAEIPALARQADDLARALVTSLEVLEVAAAG